ncbi:response regulator transcription factor [Dactylosporangium sp. NPDC006015]|uniref:response regulator transcription factor n=1 Tax=Dactylosporangium sp. NPDC006015 TaxID=3154576 RepID=UPI00339DAEB5
MRVLLVEDEEGLAKTIRQGLNVDGFAVDLALSGTDGLWAAKGTVYDAVVLDIMLPGLSGYEVCRQLRAAGVWTPVLMLTAKDGEFDEADAFDLGADDYLTKPFSFVVLEARLRALIRRGAPERPAVLTVGDLSLDPARLTVARGDEPIALTPREFNLLHFLMRHRGEVVSRTQILEGVWDTYYDGDSNVVDVYIGYLRRKIDQPFGRTAITTVRGAGYRLAADGG